MEWLEALDLELALKNVRTDITGDWYRDPWDWCELSWLVPKHCAAFAVPRLNAPGVKAATRLDVPKESFGVRPAMVMDPLDRLIYQALVDRLSTRLIGDLSSWAYGWRLPRKQPEDGTYARNDLEWEAYRRHLQSLVTPGQAALTTDVVSFFASIPRVSLQELIVERGHNQPAERLADMVGAWYEKLSRGLPQRSAASAVLAHMYLRPVDDVLRQYTRSAGRARRFAPSAKSLRWMDDIWIFGRSLLDLREAQLAVQASMRAIGLEVNIGKTDVLEDEALIEAVYEIEHSAADEGLIQDPPDEAALNALVDKLVAAPEKAPRTSLRFATKRMRDWDVFSRVPDFAECAARIPHGADYLARLFRDSEHWRDLEEWYAAYATKWTSRLPWSVGQFGTMFPSRGAVEASVIDTYARVLGAPGTPLPLLAVAAQRLAAWRPDDARVLLQTAADSESDPLARRSLALAALHAGEVKTVIRRMLREHEENALVLAMLEDQGFRKKAVPVSADFA